MKPCMVWTAILVSVSAAGALEAKTLSIKGRVVDDSRCTEPTVEKCPGLAAVVVVTKKDSQPDNSMAPCTYANEVVLASAASEEDGAFELSVPKSRVPKEKKVQVNVCLLHYLPAPDETLRSKTDHSTMVVRLSPVVETVEEAATFAATIQARVRSAGAASEERLRDEWTKLENVGYPPEARVLLGKALVAKVPGEAAGVPGLQTYAKVDLRELKTFRGHVVSGLKDSSGVLSPEGLESAKMLPPAVTQDVLIHEARTPEQKTAVIKMMQSMPQERRVDARRLNARGATDM